MCPHAMAHISLLVWAHRKVGKSMPMLVAALSHKHWQRFSYFSGPCVAQNNKTNLCRCRWLRRFQYVPGQIIAQQSCEIYMDACNCKQPQTSASISSLFWATHCPKKVRKSMPMPVDACGHKHRHRFPHFSGPCITQNGREI